MKAAFTRAYNKEQHKPHYAAADSLSKKSRVTIPEDRDGSPDTEPESDSELSQDRMVKMKSSNKGVESKVSSKGGGVSGGGKGKGKAGSIHHHHRKT